MQYGTGFVFDCKREHPESIGVTMEWMADGAWAFYSVIITVVIGIAAIILPRIQQGRRDLRYEVLFNSPLFLIADSISGKVKITFEDKELKNAHLILMNITNVGEVSINIEDYVQPLIIFFPNSIQVLHAELINSKPKNIKTEVVLQEDQIVLSPTLLNKSESITIKIITNSPTKHIYIDSRIVGISEPKIYGNKISKFLSLNINKIFIASSIGNFMSNGFLLSYVIQNANISDFETAMSLIRSLRNLGLFIIFNSITLFLLVWTAYGGYTSIEAPAKVITKRAEGTIVTQKTVQPRGRSRLNKQKR